jgi:hypothetical protein
VLVGSAKTSGIDDGFWGRFGVALHPTRWGHLVADLLGHALYTGIATLGLAVAGVVVLGAALRRRRFVHASEGLVALATFAVPAVATTFVLDAVIRVDTPTSNLTYLVYGRYTDAVLGPVLAIGAAWAFDRSRRALRRYEVARVLAFGAVCVLAVGVFAVTRPSPPPHASLNYSSVIALFAVAQHVHASLSLLLLAGVAASIVALLALALDRRAGAALVLLLLGWSSWVVYNDYAVHDSVARVDDRVLVGAIQRMRDAGVDASCIVGDREPHLISQWHVANYQFFLPASRIATRDVLPDCGPLVLTRDPAYEARVPAARPVSFENHTPIGLWVDLSRVAPSVRDGLLRRGLVAPTPITAPLPLEAYRSAFVLDPRGSTVTALRLHGSVRHAGQGSPWRGSLSPVSARGNMRIVVTVTDAGGAVVARGYCRLTRTLFPGEQAPLDCRLPLPHVAPGAYGVRVGMEQSGIVGFAARGDPDTRLTVRLAG